MSTYVVVKNEERDQFLYLKYSDVFAQTDAPASAELENMSYQRSFKIMMVPKDRGEKVK